MITVAADQIRILRALLLLKATVAKSSCSRLETSRPPGQSRFFGKDLSSEGT
jgi:hypothetical protein